MRAIFFNKGGKNEHKLKIKEYRKLRGKSQRQVAMSIGITQAHVSYIENGKESPTVRVLWDIADYLEVCPSLLLDVPCKDKCKACIYYKDQVVL